MAFCEGMAILGVVAGLLAVYMDGPVVPTDRVLAAALPVAGAVLGIALVVRIQATADPQVVAQATGFILGLAVLGPIVSYLATISARDRVDPGNLAPYLILGLALLVAIVGIGVTSSSSIRSMHGADLGATKAIFDRQILRSAIFEIVGIGSFVIALWLLVT